MHVLLVLATLTSVGGATARNETLAKLEKLEKMVDVMADDQNGAGDDAPKPVHAAKAMASDVVILEEEEERNRRGLMRVCDCKGYVNGAADTDDYLCMKVGSGKQQTKSGPCMGFHGGCNSDHAACVPAPQIHPAVSPLATVEEIDDDDSDGMTYVNVDLQMTSAAVTSYDQLPSADTFASYFAAKSGVTGTMVQARTAWGANSADLISSSNTASVHVTVHVGSKKRKNSVAAILRELTQIVVDSVQFDIIHVQMFPSNDFPLVCTPEAEVVKAETAALMQQLVDLKRQELELLRSALTGGSERCSTPALQALANHLGLPLK